MSKHDDHRDALFQAKMLEQAIKRGDTRTVSHIKYGFKHGDIVQMTMFGISRQNSSGMRPKTEATRGKFIRERAYLYGAPKYPAAVVLWFFDDGDRETETRIDYLEPADTPR